MKTDEVFFLSEPDAVGTPDARVTLFASATATTPKTVLSLQGFIAACRGETHKTAVTAVRQAVAAGDKNKVGLLKRNLPAATLSCAMTSRAKGAPERVRTHSGWLQCDFDGKENLGLLQDEIRARLQADPHVGAVFVGPSGVGIKCAVRIDGSRHRESFDSAARYFKTEYNLTIDAACKDVERLCFLSHDPAAWCRDGESQVLPVTDEPPLLAVAKPPATRSSGAGHTTSHTPTSKAEIARMLDFVPTRPGYDEWLRIISAVASELAPGEAEEVLAQWSPEERPGEYAEKLRSPLEEITLGTLVHIAREGGWEPAPKAVLKLGSARRPPAAAVAAVPVPDDGEPAVADETTFFYEIDDTDDPAEGGGSDFDGGNPPPMDYFTSKRTGRKYPLLHGKPGLRLPARNNTISRFAHGLADLLRDQPLFSRSGFCVRLDREKRVMALMKDQTFRTTLEETLTTFYLKKTQEGKAVILTLLPFSANADEARAVLASDRFLRGLRPLNRVLPCKLPVMRKSGRIELPAAGYDAETKTWVMNDPEAAYDSTPMPLAEAAAFFEDLLSEFPFAEDGGRSKVSPSANAYGEG